MSIPAIALSFSLLVIGWLFRRDLRSRPGVSAAIWWPTLWVLVISSRPISTWFSSGDSFQGSTDYSLEGSPLDRNGFLLIIMASCLVAHRRRVQWGELL